MKCHLEITGAILRLFEDDDAGFGDPFNGVLFLVCDEGTAIVKGFRGTAKELLRYREAIRECLVSHGFKEIRWVRYTGENIKIRSKKR